MTGAVAGALVSRIRTAFGRSPLLSRLLAGAFWSLLGWGASRAATLLSSMAVARLVGRVGYGEVGMVQSTLGLFGVIAGLGLGTTATKYVAELRNSDPARAGRVISFTLSLAIGSSVLVSAACMLAAPFLAESALGRASLQPLLVQGALLLLLSTVGGVCSSALSGFEEFRALARVTALQGLATPFVAVPCVLLWGVPGAVASMTVVAGVGLLLLAVALRAACRSHGVPIGTGTAPAGERARLWSFSVPSLLTGVVLVPVSWITNLLLARSPGGYAELGLFTAANQWRILVMVLPGYLAAAMLPVLSERHGSGDAEGFTRGFDLSLRLTTAVALPAAVGVILFSDALAALFGRQFAGAGPVTAVLMASVFLNTVNAVAGTALTGAGRVWVGLLMNVAWTAALLVLAAALVPGRGALGLALAYLVAYVAHTGWVMGYVDARLLPGSVRRAGGVLALAAAVLGAAVAAGLVAANPLAVRLPILALSLGPVVSMLRHAEMRSVRGLP